MDRPQLGRQRFLKKNENPSHFITNNTHLISPTSNTTNTGGMVTSNEMTTRLMREEELSNAKIKACPLCQKRTYIIDGCNNMKCWQSDPPSTCPCEWCFQCGLAKFKPLVGKEYLGCCNDSAHNSH